jgi:hypothetical protein
LWNRDKDSIPGIYFETANGEWECCPCERNKHDAAFVFYVYRPPQDQLHLACGGFSGQATRFLAKRFTSIASEVGKPQYRTPELEVGLFLIAFDIRQANVTRNGDTDDFGHRLIRVDDEVVSRRLRKPENGSAAISV